MTARKPRTRQRHRQSRAGDVETAKAPCGFAFTSLLRRRKRAKTYRRPFLSHLGAIPPVVRHYLSRNPLNAPAPQQRSRSANRGRAKVVAVRSRIGGGQ